MTRLSDRFVLLREIGSGGMSRVFLGRDEVLDRPVAVKILKIEYGGTDIGARFRREGRTAARLSHPNIVQVYDAGEGKVEGEETSYIVMEYVSGGDLKALIDERGPLSGGRLSSVGSEVAAGLAHAHERGVIHRDIKPHNVLLEEGGRARLTDFGVARALDASQATRTGSYLGTALYSPPEQLRGEEVTPKSDVYSLGATLYQAATGQPPFTGTPIEVASQHVHKQPDPPREINPTIGGAAEALILACMSKDPDDRPTADEARVALLEAGRGAHATRAYTEAPAEEAAPPRRTPRRTPPPAPPPSRAPRGGDRRRRPVALLLVLAVLLAVLGALAVSTVLDPGDQTNSDGQQGAQSDGQANGEPAGDGAEGGEGSGGQGSGGQGEQATAQAPSGEGSGGAGETGSGDSAEEEAARTLEDIYQAIDAENYDASYQLLSDEFKATEELTQAGWASTFDGLRSVRFIEGPKAQVSGEVATVTGVTIAENDGRTERNTVTWEMVREDGQWKMNQITSFEQEIISS